MKRPLSILFALFIITLVILGLAGCVSSPEQTQHPVNDRLKVVATTTFIGDVLVRIAGDDINLSILLEPGQNPHSFQPTPQNMIEVSEADLIFVNGLGLEVFLDKLLEGSDTSAQVIIVSDGISTLVGEDFSDKDELEYHQEHEGQDPHVWLNPNNVKIWVENISITLAEADPDNAGFYQSNAEDYIDELDQLDNWIRNQINQIPPENRKLITDHTTFGYFAIEYGFTQMGAMIPAMTTEAETSGQQLAELVDRIREFDVRAIFVGIDTDPTLSQRIAEEADVQLITLYFGSLSDGSPAGTYLDFMRYNVNKITAALR